MTSIGQIGHIDPAELAGQLHKELNSMARRHSNEEIDTISKVVTDGLNAKLRESEGKGERWFHGGKLSGIDIAVYGFFVNILGEDGNFQVIKLVLSKRRLREHILCGTKMWFPEYECVFEAIEDAERESI